MSADLLRRAADQARREAEALLSVAPELERLYARDDAGTRLDASRHAAVADWLDATAERVDMGRDPKDGGRRNHGWRGSREALAVARAYLGESA